LSPFVDKGWLIIASLFMTGGLIIGVSQYAFGAFVAPLEHDMGWTRTQINLSLSFMGISNICAPFIGRLIDKYGARRVMIWSIFFFNMSFLLRPFMSQSWHWYTLSALQFVSFPGAVFLNQGKLVATWFPRIRGRVMGITSMGNSVGGLILAPTAAFLVQIIGWQWTYATFGFMGLFLMLFVFIFISDSPKKIHTENYVAANSNNLNNQNVHQSKSMDISLTVKEALKTRAFYAIAIGLIAGTFTFSTVLTQIVPHLNNEGYTITSASLILSLTASFAIFGKLIFGYLAEKIQVRFVVASSLIGQALAMIVLVTEPKSAYIWLFISIYGLTYGGLGPLISLIVQDTFGLKHYASIQGLVTLASLISFFVGPLMAGMIFDATESYRPTFTIMIVLFIFGSIILTQAKPPKELQANK
jgi:MFS family permease